MSRQKYWRMFPDADNTVEYLARKVCGQERFLALLRPVRIVGASVDIIILQIDASSGRSDMRARFPLRAAFSRAIAIKSKVVQEAHAAAGAD